MKRNLLCALAILVLLASICIMIWQVWFNFYEVKAIADYPMWYWMAGFVLLVSCLVLRLWKDD